MKGQGMIRKTVKLLDKREYEICGDAADSYFDDIDRHVDGLKEMLALARQFVAAGTEIYDVGANIGVSALILCSAFPDNKIVAIEASPKNAEYLGINLSNASFKNAEVVNCAASEKEGSIIFQAAQYAAGSHVVGRDGLETRDGSVTIPTMTLDNLRKKRGAKVSFCKIDVEGHEPDVLAGACDLMQKDRPAIYMEFNSWCLNAYGGHSPAAFAQALISHFAAQYVEGEGNTSPVLRAIDLLSLNMTRQGCVTDLLIRSNGISYPSLPEMTWPQSALDKLSKDA